VNLRVRDRNLIVRIRSLDHLTVGLVVTRGHVSTVASDVCHSSSFSVVALGSGLVTLRRLGSRSLLPYHTRALRLIRRTATGTAAIPPYGLD
jgi:hypothetical protein